MKRFRLLIAVAIAGLSGSAEANSSVRTGFIFFPIVESHPWTVHKRDPYAVWEARSRATAGTEITFEGQDGVVDSASLVPQALYATDQDLAEGARVWLPKGGLLVKMAGGQPNWYCTWRFDAKSGETQSDVDKESLKGYDFALCLRSDDGKHMTNPKIMIADFKGLLTITDPESGMGKYRNGVGSTNIITISPADGVALPVRAQLQISAAWFKRNGGVVCLHIGIASRGSNELLRGDDQCFSRVGESIGIAGGKYTLTSSDGSHSFKIRIDSPINNPNLAPQIIK